MNSLSESSRSTLRRTQRHLEAIYAVEAPDVLDFVVDADTAEVLAPGARLGREAVLVREVEGEAAVAVFVAPEVVEAVAALSPGDAVEHALDEWAVVVEAVSHFLLLVRRAGRDEQVSLLELETQAEVDKFVTARLVGGREIGGRDARLCGRLFGRATLAADLSGDEAERYIAAGRLAEPYCRGLDRLPHVDAVLGELRSFYRMSGHARMERLRRAA